MRYSSIIIPQFIQTSNALIVPALPPARTVRGEDDATVLDDVGDVLQGLVVAEVQHLHAHLRLHTR